ncbi:hypothetical protein RB596_003821 [Gaeumannomyces avenae]
MPWITTSSSPSPEQQPLHSPRGHHPASSPSPPVTYIPPLIDGACGTVPHAQRPPARALEADARALLWLLPDLALTAWDAVVNGGDGYPQGLSARAAPVPPATSLSGSGDKLRGFAARAATMAAMAVGSRWPAAAQVPWRYAADVGLQLAVGVVELYIIMLALPIWLFLPGFVFSVWSLCSVAAVWCLCRLLNSSGPVVRHPGPAADGGGGSWMMGTDGEDERWFFVRGMGVSSRTITDSTLPRLAKLFNRPITAIVEPTYGLAVDLALLLAERAGVPLPLGPGLGGGDTQRLLYAQARAALQDPSAKRVVILAHNRGSLAASRVLSRLCADLPHARLSRLEVYTFGAAADEFVVPLGGGRDGGGSTSAAAAAAAAATNNNNNGTNGSVLPQSAAEFMARRGGPHIEHFAHARDPFARLGVLRSVREDLSGRFCGGVFIINAPGVSPMTAAVAARMGINGSGGRNGSAAAAAAAAAATTNGSSASASRLYSQYQYQGPHQPPNGAMMSPGGSSNSNSNSSSYGGEDRSPLLGGLLPAAPPVVSLDDYLAAMFPEQVPTLANCGRASVMESTVAVDRDVAERREQGAIASDALANKHAESVAAVGRRSGGGGGGGGAARNGGVSGLGLHAAAAAIVKGGGPSDMSVGNSSSAAAAVAVNGSGGNNSSSSSSSHGSGGGSKRLSWTGLGAKVAGGSEDGLFGLKMARKMCEECKGHRGRELSRLCHYVSSGAVMSVGGGYGMEDVREEDVISSRVGS